MVSRINLEIELGKVKETLENLEAEIMVLERLVCLVAEKVGVDYDVWREVCVWEEVKS